MTSEQTNEIAAALAKAQGQMENAKYNKVNPHFKSKYADLGAIIDAVKKPLADNGISYTQITVIVSNNDFQLLTKLLHTSGQWIMSEYPLPFAPDKPQVMGSALTYARRYELASICGISAEEDNDAEGVAEAVGDKKPPKPAPDIIDNVVDRTVRRPETKRPTMIGNQNAVKDKPEPTSDDIADATTQIDPVGIDVLDMAREAAERGEEIFKHFYKTRSAQDRAKIDTIGPELREMMMAAFDDEAIEDQRAAEERGNS